MNFGYNSNVRAGENQYHIQTEDGGPSHPCIDTVVYLAGQVVYKRSTNYADSVKTTKPESLPKLLQEQLVRQHHEVMAAVEEGSIPPAAKPESRPRVAPSATPTPAGGRLDLRLANPKTWYVSGSVTLDLELRENNSGKEIGGADVEAFLEHERNRTPCGRGRADASGRATLKFPMPATASDGAALVIRATDGTLYGELRFLLRAKSRDRAPGPHFEMTAGTQIVVNGEAREVPEGLAVTDLLLHLGVAPDRVAIERNLEILPRSQWIATIVQADDRFEIVQLVGGG